MTGQGREWERRITTVLGEHTERRSGEELLAYPGYSAGRAEGEGRT